MLPPYDAKSGMQGFTPTWRELDDFLQKHAAWAESIPVNDPRYAIPREAFDGLKAAGLLGSRLNVEKSFTDLCDSSGIIGIWGSKHSVIRYSLLQPPLQLNQFVRTHFQESGHRLHGLEEAAKQLHTAHERLQGVVGRILSEPIFLNELDKLRSEFEALPASGRPTFPLQRSTILPVETADRQKLSPQASTFFQNLDAFLARWGLMGLVAWDLPDPQGPLLPDHVPVSARPSQGVHLFIPFHYPLQGDDDLLRRVRDFQQQQATVLGLPHAMAGIAHHGQFAQMFRVMHLENAVLQRFPARRPRGMVTAIEIAAADYLGLQPDSIRRLRAWISKCKAGKRHTIKRLRD